MGLTETLQRLSSFVEELVQQLVAEYGDLLSPYQVHEVAKIAGSAGIPVTIMPPSKPGGKVRVEWIQGRRCVAYVVDASGSLQLA